MDQQPLPRIWKIRIWVVVGSSAVLVLLGLPLMILASSGDLKDLTVGAAIFVGLPVVSGSLMWWQVRRYRRDPEFRRRRPNAAASRTMTLGNLVVLVVLLPATQLLGLDAWQRLLVLLALGLPASYVVFRLAKRQDPRLHWWRRPDPAPEGHEPEAEVQLPPW